MQDSSCPRRAIIPKMYFSGVRRTLYTVGLAHTGHHLWHEALMPQLCAGTENARYDSEQVPLAFTISNLLLVQDSQPRCVPSDQQPLLAASLRRFQQHGYTHHAAPRRDSLWAAKWLRARHEVAWDCVKSCSYPCGGPRVVEEYGLTRLERTALRNPDVVALANASNAARVDLRLVVLTRAPEQIVYSTLDPQTSQWEPDLDALTDACFRMVDQLERLEPSFFLCVDYADYLDFTWGPPDAARDMLWGRFLGRDIRAALRGTWSSTNHSSQAWEALAAASPLAQRKFKTLQVCTETVRKFLCPRALAHHSNTTHTIHSD
jgi:hypothetical protein